MLPKASNPSVILQGCGIKASKALGQNFLKDSTVPERIIKLAGPLENEVVLEIGPGLGVLTRYILQASVKRLICIDIDERCIAHLSSTFHEADKITLIHADALEISEEEHTGVDHDLVLIANLPYNISTPLVLKWLRKAPMFKKMVLMFQKEVAERICALPGTKQYGSLSILCQAMCSAKLLFNVPPSAFFPQPKITSSLIMLTPHSTAAARLDIYKKLEKLCALAFSKRRKTLRNALAGVVHNVSDTLLQLRIDPNKRPENLTVEEYLSLAKHTI
jgi:16S rRNA (adenine1518-N6/adenine1519-N6)-dimethyltransferase